MKTTKEISAELRDFFLNYSDLTDRKERGCKQIVNWKLYARGDSIYLKLNKTNYRSYYDYHVNGETFNDFLWYVHHTLDSLKRNHLIDGVEPADLFNKIQIKIV